MPADHTEASALRSLRQETDMTAEIYLRHFNVRSPLQSGVEHEWQMLRDAVARLPDASPVLKAFRELYAQKISCLLCPQSLSASCALSEQQLDDLLRDRRALLSDVRDASQEVEAILTRMRAGSQGALWSDDGNVNIVRDLHDSDIPQVKLMEWKMHDYPWSGTQFSEFFGKRARSAKLYDRYGKQSPLAATVSTTPRRQETVTGYAVASKVLADRTYNTIRGPLTVHRLCLQLLTYGTTEQHAEYASKALVSDMLKRARLLECTRIENLFSEHHNA